MTNTSDIASQNPVELRKKSAFSGWFLLFLASLALFAATANRGAQWQDSGAFILRIYSGQLLNPLGLALSHPLHYWIGRLVILPNLLEPAFAITLLSSLAAAVAVANVGGCVRALTGRWSAALFAAFSLALANTFWKLATIAEVYTLGAALFSAELWCLIIYAKGRSRFALWGMLLFSGLGIANHMQASLTTPVLLVIVILGLRDKQITLKDALIGGAFWLAGTLPYSILVASVFIQTSELGATIHSALFGSHFEGDVMNVAFKPRLLMVAIGFPLFNFPNLLIPAAVLGLMRTRQLRTPTLAKRALLAALIIHLCFVVRYNVVDQHTFFLPSYVLLAILGGIGAAATFEWHKRILARRLRILAAGLLALTPLFYYVTVNVLREYDLLKSVVRNKPYQDDYAYLLLPWSHNETSAEQLCNQAISIAKPYGLIILEDHMIGFAMRYKVLRANLGEIDIVCEQSMQPELVENIHRKLSGDQKVVLVPWDVERPKLQLPVGTWQRRGDLYVLNPSPATQPGIVSP